MAHKRKMDKVLDFCNDFVEELRGGRDDYSDNKFYSAALVIYLSSVGIIIWASNGFY